MKKLICLILVLLLMSTAVTAYATTDPDPVIDHADILSPEETGQLNNALGVYGGGVLFVMTVASLDGQDVAKYAERYANQHDLGILLLISMQERQWCITASRAYKNVIDGPVIDRISAKCVPYLREDAYMEAFMVYARECGYYLENYDPAEATGGVMKRLAICLVIGLAVGAIAAGIMAGKNKSVRPKNNAADYVRSGSMHVELSRDIYLYHHVTRTAKPQSNSSGGGSGGSRSTRSGSF